jgi:pimeloyl-ACP methyl ester carboxylesterase
MEKQTLALNPYQAAYLEQGSGLSPIVCLHGFLGDGQAWLPVMTYMPDTRCIALDLLGFGSSSKPALRYTIWHQVEFLHQFVTTLGLSQFWLMGHSYGGWTAAAYAIACATGQFGLPQAQQPLIPPLSNLAGIILIAPAGIRDDQFVGRYAHLRPLLWESAWIDWSLRTLSPLCRWVGQQDTFQQMVQFRKELRQQPVAKSFLRDRLRPEDAVDTVEQHIHCIAIPTLVIAAAQDETIPLWHCQTYAEHILNAQLLLLSDADHGLLQTHPQVIAQNVTSFIAASPRD